MTHVFLLMVMLGKDVQSQDMYFYNVNRCNYFAARLMHIQDDRKNYFPGLIKYDKRTPIKAYCLPKLVDPKKVKVYK